MSGYTKLFSSILASTIWREPDHVRVVWITMLAMVNRNGIVEASVPGLADMARVSVEQCEDALNILRSPDAYSRTKDNDGRRVQDVDGGFLLLNYAKYRAEMSADDRREYQRAYRKSYRQEGRDKARCGQQLVNIGQQMSTGSIHADATASATASATAYRDEDSQIELIRAEESAPASKEKTEAAWIEELSADAAYQGIDVRREHAKMLRWCRENRKTGTRKRFINWLNRADRPLAEQPSTPQRFTETGTFDPNDL
jgi:hypothetical protein